jgi:integrase
MQYPKSDVRYWKDRVVKRTNEDWNARIRFGGSQHWWPLKTSNKEQAAVKARDIWLSLTREGFKATEEKYKPWTVAEAKPKDGVTIGDFIKAAKAVASVRPTTFTNYERKFRFMASQIFKVKGTRERHDHTNGGAEKWRSRIDCIPLSELTAQRITEWRVKYVSRFDSEPLKRQQAQQSAISILRNSKSLFAPKIVRNLGISIPSPAPFEGVEIGKRPRARYKSSVNAALLVNQAHTELKTDQPEAFDIFLLAFGAGLRRGEIDRLVWPNFDWEKATVRVEASEYGVAKTESSHDEIDIGQDMIEHFKLRKAGSKSEFIIPSKAEATVAAHWNRYRCDGHFKSLIGWLRSKGVTARNPLHTLRKEFGSLINQQFGIFAASSALRHSGIAITRDHYVDKKQRIALDLSSLSKSQAA